MASPFAAALAVALAAVPPRSDLDTLPVVEAIRLAREANPMLRAERLRAVAARERIPQAGAWPEPELGFALMNRPVDGFGTGEMMTMNTIRLSQMLPWPGKPGAARAGARALAEADSLSAEEAELGLVAEVRAGYARLAALDRSLLVMRETVRLLRGLQETATARYAVGDAVQQDVFLAQVGVARMEADLVLMEQERLAEGARFNALLARPPAHPLEPLALDAIGGAPASLDTLMAMARRRRPALGAAAARVAAGSARVEVARKEWYPDVMIGAEYGQRPGFGDMASLMFGVRLPVFASTRQQPMRREMEAMVAMQEAAARDLENETWARLTELRATAERARIVAELVETRILPQAAAAVEAGLSAYRVGRADFMTLLEAQVGWSRAAIERNRLIAEYHAAVAGIEALLGGMEVGP